MFGKEEGKVAMEYNRFQDPAVIPDSERFGELSEPKDQSTVP
jgi:hypothetical protein